MKRTPALAILVLTLITSQLSLASAQATAPATVQSTQQLPGGTAQVGTTYTLFRGTTNAVNYTLKSLEYSVDHTLADQGDKLPAPGKKNLILHLTLQNPQTTDLNVPQTGLRFTGVDSNTQSVEGDNNYYDERTHQRITTSLKPGQKVEAYTVISMDGNASLPKLIVDDSDNTVWRYDLHGKIKFLPTGFVDPASTDGSVALDTIHAKTGVYYPGTFDVRVDRMKYITTRLLDFDPQDGDRLMIVTLTLRNPLPVPQDVSTSTLDAFIVTQENLSVSEHCYLILATRDAPLEGALPGGKEIQIRAVIPIDHNTIPKALQLQSVDSRLYSINMADLADGTGSESPAATQADNPTPQANNPTTHPGTPPAQPSNAAVQPNNPSPQANNPTAQPGTPIQQPSNPAAQPDNSAPQPAGIVVAWGDNSSGQTSAAPVDTNYTAIAAGYNHSLALKSDGTVVAWGDLLTRARGGGMAVPAGLTNVSAIAAGLHDNLALKKDGTVVYWGLNALPPLTNITAITVGTEHMLALKNDGTVFAWGTPRNANVPAGLTGVTAIAAGHDYSLALKNDGTVVAWGLNDFGQSTVPAGLTNVKAIAAGYDFCLALKKDGTVVAWGNNNIGQLIVPAGLTNVKSIAAGRNHSLALKNDGTVVGWGDNSNGQISIPFGLTGVTAISVNYDHSLALRVP